MAYLGIDLGTSGLRALLVDSDGVPIDTAEKTYQTFHPQPGWSEQDPNDWIFALKAALGQIRQRNPEFASVTGIGISGHMHGAVVMDADDQVLRRCIMWNDTRSQIEAAELDEYPDVRAISGNIVFPGFTAPKLVWMRRNEPDLYDRIAKLMLPASFLSWYLTGEHVMDASDASGTSWLDVSARTWSSSLLSAGNFRDDALPRVIEGSAPAGKLRGQLATEWGLQNRVVVTAGAADNAAAACGVGAVDESKGFVSLGTSGVVLLAREKYAAAPEYAVHSFCHAVPDRWYQMGVMLSATNSINWLAGISGRSPAELTERLGSSLRPPGTITCLPYFFGERTPHNDSDVTASFTGIHANSSLDDLTQATLEGVAFGLRDCLEALRSTGAQVGPMYLVGGGAASHYWAKLIATVLNVPMLIPKGREFGAALGAARLAMMATSGATANEVMLPPSEVAKIEPEGSLAEHYEVAFARYRQAYPAIKALW